MNIDEMQAGREMDALVAEKVMGCALIECTPTCACYEESVKKRHCGCKEDSHVQWSDEDENGQVTIKSNPKAYSTDIAAAWEVVDKLSAKCIADRTLENGWLTRNFGVWQDSALRCWVAGYLGSMPICTAHSAPLAICRAALKAML